MEFGYFNKSEAKDLFDNIILQGLVDQIVCPKNFEEIQNKLYVAYKESKEEAKKIGTRREKYISDVLFGCKLYDLLTNEYGFRERDASNDDIWRFLQMQVVPKILVDRIDQNSLAKYMFNQSNRLYFKSLWWYVYLSFNNSIEDTKQMLLKESNNTDTILQMVDRTGVKGYKVKLFKEIIKQKSEKNINSKLFRKILILNGAWSTTIIPELVDGGITGYIEKLLEEVGNE